jgi:hypothetical protein
MHSLPGSLHLQSPISITSTPEIWVRERALCSWARAFAWLLVRGFWSRIRRVMTIEEVDWMYTHQIPVRKFRAHLVEMRLQLSGQAKAEDV